MTSPKAFTVNVGTIGGLRPTVNYANYFTAPAGRHWGPRKIPDYQLVYIAEGSATLEYSGRKLQLEPGHCIFYGPYTPHRLAVSPLKPLTLSSVHFSWDAESDQPVSPSLRSNPARRKSWKSPHLSIWFMRKESVTSSRGLFMTCKGLKGILSG
ncbi:AraC family ligand binding domain-containing protein [Paenibacillus sp. P25]|nr:AraC family ligand binding domain-containing protein [Paenibacillus sp. P25]